MTTATAERSSRRQPHRSDGPLCDAEGLPRGLVSTNRRNLPSYFYERLGFTVGAKVPTPDGAATMRPMHRPARGPTDA